MSTKLDSMIDTHYEQRSAFRILYYHNVADAILLISDSCGLNADLPPSLALHLRCIAQRFVEPQPTYMSPNSHGVNHPSFRASLSGSLVLISLQHCGPRS